MSLPDLAPMELNAIANPGYKMDFFDLADRAAISQPRLELPNPGVLSIPFSGENYLNWHH